MSLLCLYRGTNIQRHTFLLETYGLSTLLLTRDKLKANQTAIEVVKLFSIEVQISIYGSRL